MTHINVLRAATENELPACGWPRCVPAVPPPVFGRSADQPARLRLSGVHVAGSRLTPVHKVGQQHLTLADLEIEHATVDFAHLRLEHLTSQDVAKTAVRSAAPERLVRIVLCRTRDVKGVRTIEDVLVTVSGDVPHRDFVAFLDGCPADVIVAQRRTPKVHQRRLHSQRLVDGVVDPGVEVRHEVGELIRILLEQRQDVRH